MKEWQIEFLSGLNSIRGTVNVGALSLSSTDGDVDPNDNSEETPSDSLQETKYISKRWGVLIGECVFLLTFVGFGLVNLREAHEKGTLSCQNLLSTIFCGIRETNVTTTQTEKERDRASSMFILAFITGIASTAAVVLLAMELEEPGYGLACISALLSTGFSKKADKEEKVGSGQENRSNSPLPNNDPTNSRLTELGIFSTNGNPTVDSKDNEDALVPSPGNMEL